MRKSISLLMLLMFCSVTACAQHMNGNHHSASPSDAAETQEWAKQRLAKSSRHQESVKVKNGTR
jgi:hypothetical protein